MRESNLEPNSDVSWWYYGWIITVLGFLWFLSFLWINRNEPTPLRDNPGYHTTTGTCKSKNCARCQVLASSEFTQKLQQRCEGFFKTSKFSPETRMKITSLVRDSVMHKNDILATVYEQSGYDLKTNEVPEVGERVRLEQVPLIWMLPGLERRPFWSGDDPSLRSLVSTLDNPATFHTIKNEFMLADESGKGWKLNSVPTGKWRVYSLLNQGAWAEENASQCPLTAQLLQALPAFMQEHVFGNAMFSVLESGSSIEPHTGPCNYRLRCHLPLVTPPGYRIKVGRDVTSWEEGKLVVFDDSFVHEVWHEVVGSGVEEGSGGKEGTGSDGRAVLIFDIWHPQVTSEQQAAIQYIYTN